MANEPRSDCATESEIRASMKNHTGLHPSRLTSEALRQAGCWEVVCVLPQDYSERVRYLGNLLVQMTTGSKIEDDGLRFMVGRLTQSLSYILNSCSWASQALKPFDLDEVKRKLGRLVKGPTDAGE